MEARFYLKTVLIIVLTIGLIVPIITRKFSLKLKNAFVAFYLYRKTRGFV
jgi:hypothetical protein